MILFSDFMGTLMIVLLAGIALGYFLRMGLERYNREKEGPHFQEITTDTSGNVVQFGIYQFSRLFAPGQCQVMNGIDYQVISCELKEDGVIYTKVKRMK